MTREKRCRRRRRRPTSGAPGGGTGGTALFSAPAVGRARAPPGAHPPGQENGAGEDGERDSNKGDLGGVHREHRVGDEDLAVRGVQGHLNGQAVARGAGLGHEPPRRGRAVEQQHVRVAVGEGELVAAEGDDDCHRIGGGRQHGDGDVRPLRREGHGALSGQRDLAGGAAERLGVGVRRLAGPRRRAEPTLLGGQKGVAEGRQGGGMPLDGQAERRQLLPVEGDAVGRATRDAVVGRSGLELAHRGSRLPPAGTWVKS